MSILISWLRRLAGSRPRHHADGPSDLAQRARELRAQGQAQAASDLYWKIKLREHTPQTLVEHAEILVEAGDLFGAISRAAQALELDPGNDRAKAVQAEVRRIEEQERRQS